MLITLALCKSLTHIATFCEYLFLGGNSTVLYALLILVTINLALVNVYNRVSNESVTQQ